MSCCGFWRFSVSFSILWAWIGFPDHGSKSTTFVHGLLQRTFPRFQQKHHCQSLGTAGSSVDADDGLQLHREFAAFACNELVPAARAEIMPYWRRPELKGTIESKFDGSGRSPSQVVSPVTIADRNAEQAIRKLILDRYPNHGVIGEEFGSHNADTAEYCWVLDPIDGTKSFITGKPLFGTLIGLCRDGVPVMGVIDHPALEEQWVGIVGDSSVTFNGQTPVHTARDSPTQLKDAIVYCTTPDMFRPGWEYDQFSKIRDACHLILYGTDCYGYALVASGWGAHMVVEADLGVYDYVALVPIVQSAGGVMTDWNGEALTLQRHDQNRGRVVAAANSVLHQQAVKLLREAPSPMLSQSQ